VTLRQFMDRYGVALGVVLGLVIVIAVLPGNATSDRLAAGGGDLSADELAADASTGDLGIAAGAEGAAAGTDPAAAAAAAGGGGGAQAAATPGGVKFGSGPNCRGDGRQKGVTLYMPPCAEWAPGGNNGGATAPGVTADKITVVRWVGQVDPATRAILQSAELSDDPAKVKQIMDALRVYSNQHYETYGREVVFVDYAASGPSEND
jgi:hypothetical protein